MNLISVVIPAYNRAKTIEKCVQSILDQTYQNFEIIVVDDCSTDNTCDVVLSMKDYRIRLLKLDKNSGAQVARNKGIIEAKGDWIAFLDSDDFWLANKLELQIQELAKLEFRSDVVIHTNCYCFDVITNKKWIWNLPDTSGSCYNLLLTRPAPLFPSILTSKKSLLEIGLLDINVPSYQEWDTSLQLAQKCMFVHIQEPLFTYVFHKGETISKNLKKDIEGYEYIVNKYKNAMPNSVYNLHIKILLLRTIEYGFFDKSKEYSNILKLSFFAKVILVIMYKWKIRTSKVLNKILKAIL